ncbi:hypothetical protein CFC21_098503 [Triticum aestivum]|uniref:Uncharacterized protein n=2 Tax=Triticum aestivum TaxID=4565 RepID=A0A9R1N0Z7_WHEAT|nr:hypothetical protein CFC21_098503 [Triticum aestivum]
MQAAAHASITSLCRSSHGLHRVTHCKDVNHTAAGFSAVIFVRIFRSADGVSIVIWLQRRFYFMCCLTSNEASCLAHTTNEGFGTPFSNSISESNTPISLNSNPQHLRHPLDELQLDHS